MGEIEQKTRKELLAWYEDLKTQTSQKGDIVFVDDGKACRKVDGDMNSTRLITMTRS